MRRQRQEPAVNHLEKADVTAIPVHLTIHARQSVLIARRQSVSITRAINVMRKVFPSGDAVQITARKPFAPPFQKSNLSKVIEIIK